MNKTQQLVRVLAIGVMALCQPNLARAADANPPERMTYQGFLVDGNGAALAPTVPANYDVVFRIYNAKSGGTPIWSEQQTVTVDKGYFSVLLGEGSQVNSEDSGSLSAAFDGADASDRFIGLTVSGLGGGDVEIAPRLRLVTSPYSFIASNARRLTDGSGNANFFKEGATLKLGAGSTPTLTLPEAGGASLAGTLTVGLPSWGTGLQIDNGSTTTTIGALNASYFHFTTGLPKFYFNTDVDVDGAIRSHGQDTILGPSNNTDTYLKIFSGSNDMHAYADSFYFRGGHDFKVNLGTNTELLTDAPKFYMNKHLEVAGGLTVAGGVTASSLSVSGATSLTGAVTAGGSLSVSGDITTSGWLRRSNGGQGGLMGSSNSGNADPIYVISSSYKPNQSDLGNMYGIGFSHPNASFIPDGAKGWGMYVANAGKAGAYISGDENGRSYIKSKRGGLGVGTDSPNTAAALTALGDHSTLGYSSWPMSLYVTNSGNDLGTIAGPGGIAIGFHGPNRKIYFIDQLEGHYTATLSEGGTWWSYSDIRLKKDIEDLGNVLDKLELIRGVKYKHTYNKDNETHIGVIAQEVEKHFPELVDVMMDGDGENGAQEQPHLGVSYDGFAPVLIEAVKELRAEKDEQLARKDKRINELEDRLAKLEEMMSKVDPGQ